VRVISDEIVFSGSEVYYYPISSIINASRGRVTEYLVWQHCKNESINRL